MAANLLDYNKRRQTQTRSIVQFDSPPCSDTSNKMQNEKLFGVLFINYSTELLFVSPMQAPRCCFILLEVNTMVLGHLVYSFYQPNLNIKYSGINFLKYSTIPPRVVENSLTLLKMLSMFLQL